MTLWAWAILLLVTGLGLTILEVFFPSGGILGFLAVCSVVAAIVLAFRSGPAVGLGILAVAMIGLPVVVIVALKAWPHTAMGRRILLMVPKSEDVLPNNPKQRRLKSLVGQIGQAKSKMLPSGAVTVEGHTIDAVSEGMPIEPGQRVKILEVRGNRVVVRPLDEDELPSEPGRDPLSRPIDSVGPDPFDESPA